MEGELFYKCLFDQNHLVLSKTVLTLSMPEFITKHEKLLLQLFLAYVLEHDLLVAYCIQVVNL